MDDNSELDLSGIFCGVLLIAGMAHFQIIEDSLSVGLKIELLFLHMCHQSEILHSLIFIQEW